VKDGKAKDDLPSPPVAKIRRSRKRLSLAWLAPIAALTLTGVLGYQAFQRKGIPISISFEQAHGIAPDDAIVYRGLRVGTVRDVRLSEDLARVQVLADIRSDARAIAREGSQFWIVRPTVTLREISGLDTLLGSRYIAVEPDAAATSDQSEFAGMGGAPVIEVAATDALVVTLKAKRRGSIVPGSPVSYRDMTVGRVRDLELAPDATGVLMTAEIDKRFAVLVHENTRFWNSSGIGIDFGIFRGLSVQTDSLESIVGGGIAFATPSVKRMGERVTDGHLFELAEEVDEDWLDWKPEIVIAPIDSP
jgi:paraquat-inducible protein B